jgi:hypothetical protein
MLFAFAILDIAAISDILSVGFVGDSIQISFVLSVTASATLC